MSEPTNEGSVARAAEILRDIMCDAARLTPEQKADFVRGLREQMACLEKQRRTRSHWRRWTWRWRRVFLRMSPLGRWVLAFERYLAERPAAREGGPHGQPDHG